MPTFAVIGLGQFGQALASALADADADVIAIDMEASRVEAVREVVTLAVRMDSSNEESLRSQGVHEADVAIVGIGEAFEASVLTVATLKSMGCKRIIARAENDLQRKIMERIGADEIVSPERESAHRWAHRLMLPRLEAYIDLGERHGMVNVVAPRAFHHKTLAELGLRNNYDVNLVAIRRRVSEGEGDGGGSSMILTVPAADTGVEPGDLLILVGTHEALDRLPKDE